MQFGMPLNANRWSQFSEWELQMLYASMFNYQQCYSPIKNQMLQEVKAELDRRNQGFFMGGSASGH